MTMLKSLTHRPFALLWSGQTVSRLGDSIFYIALAWLVVEKTGSATVMGTVLIFAFIPMVLFALIGGVAVDRFSPMKVMFASDLLSGAVISLVALLAYANRLELWHIFLAALVFGFVAAFFQPAYTAIVPEITPPEALPSANSLTSLSGQLTGVIGPALGASIVALGGYPAAFALDGLSFFISAACLLPLIPLATQRVVSSQRPSALGDLREGIGTVIASPWLWMSITLFALTNVTASAPWNVALPLLVKGNLHADVGLLGVLNSTASLGMAIGAVWLGRLQSIRRRGVILYGGSIIWGLTTLAFGLPIPILVLGLAALIRGLVLSTSNLVWTNMLQELVPRHVLGRVSSIDYMGSFVFLPLGYAIMGYATDQIGAPLVFVIGGALTAVPSLVGLLHPAIRNLD